MRRFKNNYIKEYRLAYIWGILCLIFLSMSNSAWAATGTWISKVTGGKIYYTSTEANSPIKDFSGKYQTVVYLENLGFKKTGGNSNATDVAWLLSKGFRVIELDYGHNPNAVSPTINADIIEINDEIANGAFCGYRNCSSYRSYVLFEGYRILLDVPYFKDNPTVYNSSSLYTIGDSLRMDIVYPANNPVDIPVILSFSYSNSSYGNSNQRMNLGYTFAGFNDSFLEGAPAQGMAWAIADHPKYCPWGNGKPVNGANDTYKSYETNPDAAQKVKSAIRTLRILGEGLNLNGKIGVYGFSRGSDAGSMAIGDRIVPEFENAGFNIGTPDSVQAAALGPGVFDFTQIYNTTGDGDNNLETRCPWGWGALKDNYELWNSMGSSYLAQSSKTAPVLFFYNTNDSHYYADQITKFKARLDSINVPTSSLIDYGTGHAVPQTSTSLNKLYAFFSEYLTPQSPIRVKEDSADICMVTVDTETGKNMLVWEPKSGYHIKEYRIYRESKVVNVYNQIGTVLFNEVSKFIDPTVLPELEQSKYKLSVVDSFNIESELGKYHKPIFLQYISTGASVELEWDAYEVEYGSININNYVIFRGSDSTRLQIIDTVLASSRTYTDHDTLALKSLMFYRVAGVKNETCAKAGINSNESGRAVFCLSNLANNNLFALNTTEAVKTFSRSLFLSPNPVREELNLSFNIANPVELHIGIYDITGFLLYKTEKKYNYTGQQNETIRLDEHSFPKGIYYVSVGCQEWQVTKKFIKE